MFASIVGFLETVVVEVVVTVVVVVVVVVGNMICICPNRERQPACLVIYLAKNRY